MPPLGYAGYGEDEDELLDMDDKTPYDSVAARPPLIDPGLPKINVKDYIAQKQGMAPAPPASSSDYSSDPLMKQFEIEQTGIDDLRDKELNSSKALMYGRIGETAARGANDPVSDDSFYRDLYDQRKDAIKSKQGDLDRRQKVIGSIEARKGKEAVANATNEYRKMNLAMRQKGFDEAAKTKKTRLDSLNIGRVNALYQDQGINRETTKLNASRSAQSLLDKIKSGEIKGSKNIRNQLTTIMSTIEMGGPGAVSDREAMGVNNLYTKAKDALSFIDSHPNDSIPPEYLTQLEIESHALGDRAAKNYNALANSKLAGADLSGGDPELDPGQIHKLASQRRLKFLSENGYDADGNPMRPSGGSGGLISSAMADGGAPKTKKIGNDTYIKVQGGWQLVQPDGVR